MPAILPRRERLLVLLVTLFAAGVLVWGVVAEQIGETLFNATLV